MADKTVIIKLDVQEAGAEAQLVSLNNKLSKLTAGEKDYELVLKKIAIQEERLSKIQAKRAVAQGSILKETKNTTKVLNKQADATGSATAATMELSRVISDAPYGIRGMANNITQLVSQLGTASTKAGGLGGALKLMGKQLMGPLGVVFAITAVVAAFDYFMGGMKKVEKGLESVGESAAKSASALKILVKANDSGAMSMSQTAKAVKKANLEYKDLNIQVGENGKITDESVLAINRKVASLENLARATALQGMVEEQFVKLIPLEDELKTQEEEALVKLRIKGINSIKEAQAIADDKKFHAEKGYVTGILNQANFTKSKIDEIQNNIDKLIGNIPNIDDLFKGKEPKGGSGAGKISLLKTPKEYEGDLFEIEDMLRKFSGKELLRNAKTEEEKNTAKAIIELEGFKKSFQDFRLSEDEKLVEFKEALEKKRLAEIASAKGNKKRISEINAIFDKTSLDAQETYELESTISYNNYITGLKAIVDKNKPDLILGELGRTQLDRDKATEAAQEKHLTFRLENFAEYADTAKQAISSMTDFINGEYDRELIIEQNKTNSLNTELNNRLLNENLSKEQRRKIQNEIAQNDEKLRVRQEIIEKKRFKTNKAANIASALMDTATAAVGVMKDSKGDFFARLAQAIPTIAFGLAQVAIIARQKFQSSASKTPISTTGGGGSSGGGSERAEPSFNIVGRSDDNLLINAIQATFDKPLKAYVVARDVTNQQQLDGIITDKAGT